MDIVNSVTQNSNNRNTTMENQGGGGMNDDDPKNSNGGGAKTTVHQNHDQDAKIGLGGEKRSSQVPEYLRAIGMDPRKFWPKKYRFTREKSPGQHNPLTIAQRNFYESNGYIVLDDCVSRRLLDQIRSSKKQQKASPSSLFNNNEQTVAKVPHGSSSNDFVDEFLLDKLLVRNGRLAQYVKCFCDEKFMLMTKRLVENFQTNEQLTKDIIDNKGNTGNRQALFRDWIYLPFRPIDKVVGTIIAMEPIEHVILLVPGTHRVGQCTISSTLDTISAAYESSQEKAINTAQQVSRELYESSPGKLSELVDKSRKGFKYINLKPGQTLFYHPGLVHGFSNDLVNFNKQQLAALAYYAAADCEFVDLRHSILSLSDEQQTEQVDENKQHRFNELVPINLAHFGSKNPRDYRSWLDKPRLVGEPKANL